MRKVAVRFPEGLLKGLEQLVDEGFYLDKAEAIRMAVRDLLKREKWTARC